MCKLQMKLGNLVKPLRRMGNKSVPNTIGTVLIPWAGHFHANFSLRKKIIVSFIIVFGTLSFPIFV